MNELDFDKINDFLEISSKLFFIKNFDAVRYDRLQAVLGLTDNDEVKLSNAISVITTVFQLFNMAYYSMDELEVFTCDKDFELIDKVFKLLSIILKKDVNFNDERKISNDKS